MQEIEKIKELVKQQWLELENIANVYSSDAAHYPFIAFDYLLAEKGSSQTAWENFEEFYKANELVFTPAIKQSILQSARNIAQAPAGTDKADVVNLAKLELLFGED